jgi:hypothetical protein
MRMRLINRGIVRPGMKADIAVFDMAEVKEMATFEKPDRYAAGTHLVIVNGQIVLEEHGRMTSARAGRALFGPGHGGNAIVRNSVGRPSRGPLCSGLTRPASQPLVAGPRRSCTATVADVRSAAAHHASVGPTSVPRSTRSTMVQPR